MAAAIALTVLAFIGVILGVRLGDGKFFSSYLTAAGGGLLSGLSIFWLLPESAELSGWPMASLMTAAACILLLLVDHLVEHSSGGYAGLALGPLLAATALHSLVDGWSVRALSQLRLANISGPLGLALHKIPEGLALGWITHRKLKRPGRAALLAMGAELFTLIGAFVEPKADRSGFAEFGSWWTAAVVAVISGSFLFFAVHALIPNRRSVGAMLVFLAALAITAMVGLSRISLA